MSDYKERLRVAKKSYIATDGPGESGVRLWWCLMQVTHSYTNMDVENLRVLFPDFMLKESPFFGGKDWAYVVGHITQFFIVPTIVMQVLTLIKVKREV
jgi:hypothetical protein